MNYRISFNGVVTSELGNLLHGIEKRLNGYGIHAQTSTDTSASTVASGSTNAPCPKGEICPDGAKGGHDLIIILVTAVVAGALGYVAGKLGAKGGHDGAKGGHD